MAGSTTHAGEPGFKDRRRRLALFGVLAGLVGLLGVGLGLLHTAMLFTGGLLSNTEALSDDARSAVMGLLLWVPLGVLMIVLGVGSVRLRRWSRPILLIVTWIWLITGLLAFAITLTTLDDLALIATADIELVPAEVVALVMGFVVALSAVFELILPALFVWAYSGADVRRTLEARSPGPSWTDRCPMPVLALTVGLGLGAMLMPSLAVRPVVPWFGGLVTGWPGSLMILAGLPTCLWLARATFRLEGAGWWAVTILTVLLGASFAITLARIEPVELYREMGYPEQQLAIVESSPAFGRATSTVTTIALTVLSVGYMVAIRRWFFGTR